VKLSVEANVLPPGGGRRNIDNLEGAAELAAL
jgi:hypothetical protein